jgi:cytoskeleton protein RodZ
VMSEPHQQETIQDETGNQGAKHAALELPGRRLREKRESNHLSREEVAHHLRLDAQLITALEDDDYSRLPSPAYICGYLRSYARLLKLNEDEIVRAYSHGEQIHAALIPESVSILPKKMGVSFALVKTIVIILIAALVASGLYVVAEKFDVFNVGSHTKKSSELTVPIAPAAVEQPAADDSAAPGNASESSVSNDTQTPQAPQTSTAPASVADTTVIEQLPTPKTKIPGVANLEPPKPSAATATPAVNAKESQTLKTTPSEQTAPAATTQTLRLHFLEDSWAEITDNTGKRLIYQLVEKNADLNLDGEPPFTILLGNAPAVQVFYNGKEFDHARYHRGEIAYFRVGVK